MHVQRLVVDLVLDRQLASRELGPDVGLLLFRGASTFGLDLQLEGTLGLHVQLGAAVAPARELARLQRHAAAREVADLMQVTSYGFQATIYELHVKDHENDQESLDVALIWLSTWLRTRGRIDSYSAAGEGGQTSQDGRRGASWWAGGAYIG